MRLKLTKTNAQKLAEAQGQRVKEYPSLADFADAFYWQQKGKPGPMNAYLAKIDAIKAAHPLPPGSPQS